MIGAEPPVLEHRDAVAGDVVLRVNGLQMAKTDHFGVDLEPMDLTVRGGEVVGIAGVSGNGQKELLALLSGEDTRAEHSMVEIVGEPAGKRNPQRRRSMGLHYVPEERLGRGAVPSMGLAQNLLLTRTDALGAFGWIDTVALRAQAQRIIARFGVKAGGPDALAKSLSGGNLQKFIVGREVESTPRLLIIAQPTWGVDVGAAAQIRAELLALRDAGCAVLVVSEELDELFEISDRLHVIAKGRLSPSLPIAQATVAKIGEWMSGLWDAKPQAAGKALHNA
jgi:simple sugar transport system ATP-binding protein